MRVKRGLAGHRRHKKYLDAAKGFRGGRSRLYRTAREAVERSLQNAFTGRKLRKRDFRSLWITRISAACNSAHQRGRAPERAFLQPLHARPEGGGHCPQP